MKLDANELVNSIMISSSNNGKYQNLDLWDPDTLRSLLPGNADDFDIWFSKSKFNYKFVDLLIKYCPDKFFKWWNPYKIKLDRGIVYLLAEHCGKFSTVWWSDIIKEHTTWLENNTSLWYQILKNCSCSAHLWWDTDVFPWHNEVVVEYLIEYGQNYKHIWGNDYIMHKLINEEQEVAL